MALNDDLTGFGGVKSGVEIWPLRRYSNEAKTLSLGSVPRADAAAMHCRRIISALALRDFSRGSMLYVVTRRSSRVTGGLGNTMSIGHMQRARPASLRYHIRCFDAAPQVATNASGCLDYRLGAPYDGELWHYPPGHEECGWESAISCMEVTATAVVIGSVSGRLHMLHPTAGTLIKTISWLHVDEIAALASANGMLWSVSSQVAALRLRPLSRFGVVAVATQTQLSSRRGRLQALWLVTVEFWVAALLVVVEAIQLLRFAAASEVCSETGTRGVTCIRGYQLQTGASLCANSSADAALEMCCACGGGDTSDNILNLPPAASVVLKEVSDFGLDQIDTVVAVWTGCSLILCFLLVLILAEPLKRGAFFSPDGWQATLLSVLSVFTTLMCQPMLVPMLRLVGRAVDCTHYDELGYLIDNSDIVLPSAVKNTSSTVAWSTDYEWQQCWHGPHLQLLAIPALVCLIFYVPACVRLLRVGGSLLALSTDVGSIFKPWAWCTFKDDDITLPNLHPFSMRDGSHKLLVVGLKAVGVLATVFLGTNHRVLVGLVLVVIAACLVVLSCALSPFHGEAANRFRAAIDLAVLTSYVAALVLVMLLEQSDTKIRGQSESPPVLFYPSSQRRQMADIIANWLPGLAGLSLVLGWFMRALVFHCKAWRVQRRVHPQVPPPLLEPKLMKDDEETNGEDTLQSSALTIQRRQRTRSSGRRLAAALANAAQDTSAISATRAFGFADGPSSENCPSHNEKRVATQREQKYPAQLPPLAPIDAGRRIARAKQP